MLGMDFLWEYSAMVNVWDGIVPFSTGQHLKQSTERKCRPLRIANKDVCIPPLSCRLVSVSCCGLCNKYCLAEQITALLRQGAAVTCGTMSLRNGQAELLLTSFTNERKHISKGTVVAYPDKIAHTQRLHCCAVGSNDWYSPLLLLCRCWSKFNTGGEATRSGIATPVQKPFLLNGTCGSNTAD